MVVININERTIFMKKIHTTHKIFLLACFFLLSSLAQAMHQEVTEELYERTPHKPYIHTNADQVSTDPESSEEKSINSLSVVHMKYSANKIIDEIKRDIRSDYKIKISKSLLLIIKEESDEVVVSQFRNAIADINEYLKEEELSALSCFVIQLSKDGKRVILTISSGV